MISSEPAIRQIPWPLAGEGQGRQIPSPLGGEGQGRQIPSPLAGEGRGRQIPSPLAGEGQGGGYEVNVVAVPVTDTCKEVVDGLVTRTIPRDVLADARGPWTFRRETLMQALDRVGTGADISSLIELSQAAGLRVRVVIPQ